MRNISKLLVLTLLTLTVSVTALADDFGARVRLQGNTSDVGYGLGGVLEVPTLSAPGVVLAGAGVSHVSDRHNVLVTVGGLVNSPLTTRAHGVVDARGSVVLTDNVFTWFNLRLNNFDDADLLRGNVFAMVDYSPFSGVLAPLAVGVETDNQLKLSNKTPTSDFSVGPNVLVNLSKKVRMEFAYQVHNQLSNRAWARLNLMF